MTKQASTAWPSLLALAAAATLGGCATAPRAPMIATTPTPASVRVEPQPPAGASADLVIPARDADGRYLTPNHKLGPEATIWHVRSALNVAALGCRGPGEVTLIANYNALLAGKRALLAAAFARTEADARAGGSADWRTVHDRQMTRLYNFFAQPPAKAGFCAVATEIAAEAAATPANVFPAFAAAALPRLEAPFLAFYRAYDDYRGELAAWRGGATAAAPQLGYASMDTVIAWFPAGPPDRRLAANDR